ncbi:MAG: hypothetical protein U0800_12720 [Isosphaeraceae bacterium]
MKQDDEYTPAASSTVDYIADMVEQLQGFRDFALDLARKLRMDDQEACDTFCAMEQQLHDMLEAEWSRSQDNLSHCSEKELEECDWSGYEQDMPTYFPSDLTPVQLKAMIAKRNMKRRRPVTTNPATKDHGHE